MKKKTKNIIKQIVNRSILKTNLFHISLFF